MTNKCILIITGLLLTLPTFLVAQEKDKVHSHLTLEELSRIKIKTASHIEKEISKAPAIVSTFNRSEIQAMGVTSLIDILTFVPGIETSISSEGNYRVSFRGLRNDGEILVLLNGQEINNSYSGAAVYDLSVNNIEKIEIIRGPGSAIYGTNAIIGVINIYTSKAENDIILEGGTNTNYGGNINYHDTISKNISFTLNAGYRSSDGANVAIETDDAERDTWSLTHKDKTALTNRWMKQLYILYELDINKVKLNYTLINHERGPWAGTNFIMAPNSKNKLTTQLLNLSYDYKVSETMTITPEIHGKFIKKNAINQETPDGYVSSLSNDIFIDGQQNKEKYDQGSIGGELSVNIKLHKNVNIILGNVYDVHKMLNYSLERNYYLIKDEYVGTFGNHDNVSFNQKDKDRKVIAFYAESDFNWKKINLVAGFRYDDYSDFGESLNPRMSIAYSPNKKIYFKTLYGKAFRAPTFLELYDQTNLGPNGIRGNELLSPEIINNFEVEIGLTLRKIYLRANSYYYTVDDIIRPYDIQGNGATGYYENIGDLNTYGVEGEIIYAPTKTFKFLFNVSSYQQIFKWNTDKVNNSYQDYLDNRGFKLMAHMPFFRANLATFINLNKITFFTGLNYGNASQSNDRFALEGLRDVEIPSYITLSGSISYKLSKRLNVSLLANNIGSKYSDPDESVSIDAFGSKGLKQQKESVLLRVKYIF